jgi:hypothetical protein
MPNGGQDVSVIACAVRLLNDLRAASASHDHRLMAVKRTPSPKTGLGIRVQFVIVDLRTDTGYFDLTDDRR